MCSRDVIHADHIDVQEVKGYYDCAFNRFVDYICLAVENELFPKIRDELYHSLRDHFDLLNVQGKFDNMTVTVTLADRVFH